MSCRICHGSIIRFIPHGGFSPVRRAARCVVALSYQAEEKVLEGSTLFADFLLKLVKLPLFDYFTIVDNRDFRAQLFDNFKDVRREEDGYILLLSQCQQDFPQSPGGDDVNSREGFI